MAPSRSPQSRTSLSVPVQVRLSPEIHERYAEAAAAQGVGVSTYLRRRLEAADPTNALLSSIQETLYEIEGRLDRLEDTAPSSSSRGAETPDPVAIETLMLLQSLMRFSGRSKDVEMIRSELRRQGITPWELPYR